MDRILDDGFKQPAAENVLIQSRTATAGTPAFDAAVTGRRRPRLARGDVRNVRSPLAPGNADQVSKDRHSALVGFDIRGEIDKAPDKVGPVVDAVAAAQAAHPGFFIGEIGDASAPKAVADQYGKDLGKAGTLSLPITLIILLVTFGALVAAGIPLLLALTAVFGTFGLVALPSHVLPMANEVPALVLLVGLAVGVDYSMFYLRREREERAEGPERAGRARSGRRHLGPLGADLRPDRDGRDGRHVRHRRQGVRLVRRRDDARRRGRDAGLAHRAAGAALAARRQGRQAARPCAAAATAARAALWGWIVDRVLRRPALSAALAGGAAAPARPARDPDADGGRLAATRSRRSLEVVKTYKRMQQAFPGTALPANVIVKAPNVNAPAVRAGDRAARAAGARERPRARADHGRPSTRPARSRTSRSRSTATAATRRRTPR